MEALDQGSVEVDSLDRRTRLAGLTLSVGGFMFFAFWINSILDSPRSVNAPWPLQLAFHGVMLLFLLTGFALTASSLPLSGWQRISWQVGAGLIMVGVVVNFGLFVAGVILVGAVQVLAGRHRSAGTAMLLGSFSWLAVWFVRRASTPKIHFRSMRWSGSSRLPGWC